MSASAKTVSIASRRWKGSGLGARRSYNHGRRRRLKKLLIHIGQLFLRRFYHRNALENAGSSRLMATSFFSDSAVHFQALWNERPNTAAYGYSILSSQLSGLRPVRMTHEPPKHASAS